MKKNSPGKRGPQDSVSQHLQPDKVGWIRKFCGKGIFREIWKNRFMVLRGDQLFICEKEVCQQGRGLQVKEPGRADEVLDLLDYERCEEIRKSKSRSKKNHSKFRLQGCSTPGNTVQNVVFLAISPEDKESWINVLNAAITWAKNRILDEVTVEESQLSHPTRDRAKIPQNRRLPTRGHLLAVVSPSPHDTPFFTTSTSPSPSDGMLTLDLIQEDAADAVSPPGVNHCDAFRVCLDSKGSPRSNTDSALSVRTAGASGKSRSLPREAAVVWEQTSAAKTLQPEKRFTTAEKNHCLSMDQILTHSEPEAAPASRSPASTRAAPVSQLQQLIRQKLEKTEQLLTEAQEGDPGKMEPAEGVAATSERLLREAVEAWNQAHEVLKEVKELRVLYQQLDSSTSVSPGNSTKLNPDHKSPK